MQLAKKILLVILGLILGGAIGEIILFSIGFDPQLSSDWILGHKDRVPDRDVLNISRKFIEPDYYSAYLKQESDQLIVALGDSFTDGYPVARCPGRRPPCPNDDSYPGVLEKLLSQNNQAVSVVRAGMTDTGPDQQLRLFKKYILPNFRPQIVVWQFYSNDTVNNVLYSTYDISDTNELILLDAKSNWSYQRLRLYNLIPLPESIKKQSRLVKLTMSYFENKRFSQVPKHFVDDPREWGRKKIVLAIEEMTRLSKLRNFQLYLVLVAPQAYYLKAADPTWNWPDQWDSRETEYQLLKDIFERQSNYISGEFTPEEIGSITGLPVTSISDTLFASSASDHALKGIRHFNEVGYTMLAHAVANRITLDQQQNRSNINP